MATTSWPSRLAGTVAMQALTTRPFTSISQAPQLPPRQPVGMETATSRAALSQSRPGRTSLVRPFGHRIATGSWANSAGLERCEDPTETSNQERCRIHVFLEGIGEAIQQGIALPGVMGLHLGQGHQPPACPQLVQPASPPGSVLEHPM
jgi:hypothetical protein